MMGTFTFPLSGRMGHEVYVMLFSGLGCQFFMILNSPVIWEGRHSSFRDPKAQA